MGDCLSLYVVDERKDLHTTSGMSSTVCCHAGNFKVMWFSHRVGVLFRQRTTYALLFFFWVFFSSWIDTRVMTLSQGPMLDLECVGDPQ